MRAWGAFVFSVITVAAASAQAEQAEVTVVSASPTLVLSVDWLSGSAYGHVPLLGAAHGFGVEADLAVLRAIELGGRYELVGVGLPGERGTAFSHQLLGMVRLRWISDPHTGHAWTIGGGYGIASRGDELGGDTRLIRLSLARELGVFERTAPGLGVAVEVAYERSLSETRLDMTLASVRISYEGGRRAPPRERSWHSLFPHSTSLDLLLAGLGFSVGVRANRYLSLETSANYLMGGDDGFHWMRGAQWAVQTGPRVQLVRWPIEDLPAYLQVQGGLAWIARDPAELRHVQTAEIGVRVICGGFGIDGGAWLRTQIADGALDPVAVGLVVRFVLGTTPSQIGGTGAECRGTGTSGSGKTYELRAPDLPNGPVNAPPPPRVEVPGLRGGSVWIAGRWEWRDGDWEWRDGHWDPARAGSVWVGGSWQQRGRVYVWIDGRWQSAPSPRDPPE